MPIRSMNRRAAVALWITGSLALLAGCGGDSGPIGDTTPPSFTNPVFTTTPSPLTSHGGSGTVQVTITDPAGVNTTTYPPKVDVTDLNNVSLLGGAQNLTLVSNQTNVWTYTFTIPQNTATAAKQYGITASATDGNGNSTSVLVTTFSVPPSG